MKKKFFGSIVVLAIAAIAAFNVNVNTQWKGLSDISLQNIEALASEVDAEFCTQSSGCRIDYYFTCHVYYLGWHYRSCPYMRGF